MTVNYTTNLALGQPVTGTESGTWGDDVNNSVTSYLDIAIAGSLALTSASFTANALTIANTQGNSSATNIGATTAQYYVLRVSSLAANVTITAPSVSKTYLVVNADATYSVTVKASGQTGISVAAGERATVYYNGTDYIKVTSSVVSNLTGTLPVANGGTGVTTSTGTGNVVLSTSPTLVTPALGTPASGVLTNATGLPLTTGITGTLPIANGGTGLTTTPANGALDIGNGTGFTRATLTAGSNVTITNSAGGISIASTNSGGTVTSVAATVPAFLSVTGSPVTTSGTLAIGLSGTALPVANGGTGVTTSTGSGNSVLSTSPTITSPTLVTPALGTPTSGTLTNCTFPTLNQNTTGNAATVTTNANLTGDVTSVGNTTTLTNAPVIAKVLTGYVSGAGTVAATDSILQAIQKLDGNNATNSSKIQPITASVASSAMTVTLNPTSLDFRATPLTSGTVNTRTVSAAISVVVPATATLGTVSAQQSRIVVLALDNAGTIELAVVNIAGGNNLDETTLISTTAIAAGSNTASVVYSTTARTSLPFRVVGYVESTQATAGTWATAPSTIQGYGGQALAAMSSLGYGQTWQDVSGSRSPATTYYNTTGRPIFANVFMNGSNGGYVIATINGVSVFGQNSNAVGGIICYISFIVPPSGSYSVTMSAGTPTANAWSELR